MRAGSEGTTGPVGRALAAVRAPKLAALAPVLGALALTTMLALTGALAAARAGAANVTTAGYGNLRDDWDAEEPGLGPAEVSPRASGSSSRRSSPGRSTPNRWSTTGR
jgi:hypothetical protein